MRLIVEKTQLAEPVLPIRWCLDPKDVPQINSVQKGGDQEIAIIIVILYEKGGEKRIVTKVDEMMVHLSFDRPGNHTVVACLVSSFDLNTLKKRIQMKDDDELSGYRYNAYDPNSREFSEFIPNGFLVSGTKCEIEVVVPMDHFPKKPNKLLWKIANYPHEEPAKDQCSYRRRLLFSWPLSILLMLISVLIVLIRVSIAAFLTLLGQRGVNWRAVFHPRDFDTEQVCYGVRSDNNWFLCDSFGNKRPWQVRMLNPLLWIAVFVIGLVSRAHGGPFMQTVIYISLGVIMFTFYMSVLQILVSRLWKETAEGIKAFTERKKEKKLSLISTQPQGEILYNVLGCHPGTTIEAKVSALPASKQTIKLRYLDIKAQVCRPFPKG